MDRIDTTDGLFLDGNPATGTKGSLVTATWLNNVQEEIARAVELLGGTLDSEDREQLGSLLKSYSNRPGDFIFLPYEPTTAQMTERRILLANGGSVLDTDFPDILTAWGGKVFGNIDSTHFYLPLLCGYFPRFWDHGAGVDPDAATRTDRGDGTSGDVVGSIQGHMYELHDHGIPPYISPDTGGYAQGASIVSGEGCLHQSGVGFVNGIQVASGGNETRPKNIYIWGGVFF